MQHDWVGRYWNGRRYHTGRSLSVRARWRGAEIRRRNEVECLKVVQPRHRCILLLRRTAVRGDVRVIRTSRGVNG